MKFNSSYRFTNNKYATLVVGFIAFFTFGAVQSQSGDVEDIEKIRAELVKIIPAVTEAKVTKTDAKNVYQIEFQGAYAYSYVDGDFVLVGDLYNSRTLSNLGDEQTNKKIVEAVSTVPTSKMIVYGPENPKRYITVFTDIDCGYCRKLHSEVSELTAAGIQVRYLAFPRAGIGSQSYNKYVSVWCNGDQQDSLTKAKSGVSVASATCANPIEETYKLGQEIGVRGTPMVIFDDGNISPGYLPSAELIRRLGLGS